MNEEIDILFYKMFMSSFLFGKVDHFLRAVDWSSKETLRRKMRRGAYLITRVGGHRLLIFNSTFYLKANFESVLPIQGMLSKSFFLIKRVKSKRMI